MQKIIFFALFSFLGLGVRAQNEYRDTISVIQAVKNGNLNGNLRSFTMATDNQKMLSDGFANALALSLRFETAPFHHFQFAVGAAAIANLYSSNLVNVDPITQQFNRYEIGLFDLTHPSKKYNLYRLEELYLKYNFKQGDLKVGRQFISNTFINFQDGRMRPTAIEGAFATINVSKKLNIKTGLIWKVAPRSTINFYSPGDSFGIYPMGVNDDGTKAVYKSFIKSNAIAVLELQAMLSKTTHFLFSNVFTEQVFNTSLIQLEKVIPINQYQFLIGFQTTKQFKVGNGGNQNQQLAYFKENATGFTFGGKMGIKNKNTGISLNYNRITAKSKYLFPREWGKDPFYTFLPRERNEGFGDVHALSLKLNKDFLKNKLTPSLAFGYYHLPDVKNYRLNKYGMPSYTQLNLELKYKFNKMDVVFLSATKWNKGRVYNNDRFVINKVNMTNYNFVVNYNF